MRGVGRVDRVGVRGRNARADVRAMAVVGGARRGGLVERGGRGLVWVSVHLVIRVHGIRIWRSWVGLQMGGKGG